MTPMSLGLLVKLGSLIVHADEFLSDGGHQFDKVAFEHGLADPEVAGWISEMTRQGFLPVKRLALAIGHPVKKLRKQRTRGQGGGPESGD